MIFCGRLLDLTRFIEKEANRLDPAVSSAANYHKIFCSGIPYPIHWLPLDNGSRPSLHVRSRNQRYQSVGKRLSRTNWHVRVLESHNSVAQGKAQFRGHFRAGIQLTTYVAPTSLALFPIMGFGRRY